MGLVKDVYTLGGSFKQAKENRKAARDERTRNMALLNGLDFEPMYASETVPTYQKTQSPVARSYLESFLSGNNPNMTFSGAPNAAVTKAAQQRAQNAMFGTPEQRVAQQRQIDTQTPWQVKTPTRKVKSEANEPARVAAENPLLAEFGVTDRGLADALKAKKWIKPGGDDASSPLAQSNINQLMMAYGGDQAAAAEALSTLSPAQLKAEVRKRAADAGGWDALRAKYPQWTTRA